MPSRETGVTSMSKKLIKLKMTLRPPGVVHFQAPKNQLTKKSTILS
jgi:hypothetical protein